MIDVKSAVRTAMGYLLEFQEFIPARDIRLEEVELDDSGDWLITLSILDPMNIFSGKRDYKLFRIDAETGAVKSMKVRSLQPVE